MDFIVFIFFIVHKNVSKRINYIYQKYTDKVNINVSIIKMGIYIIKEFPILNKRKYIMENINHDNQYFHNKPGSRFHIVRDQERKEDQLNKYLNSCQLYKRVNPEINPQRSELIKAMYDNKKVMKNRQCRKRGAKEFNFKKQSANQIITHNKFSYKGNKYESENRLISKRQIQDYSHEDSYQE